MVKKLKKLVAFFLAVALLATTMLNFPAGMLSLKASAAEITATQPENGDGTAENPYQIQTKEHLYWFAYLVNGKLDGVSRNSAANAVLTESITVNSNVLNADGSLADDTSDFTIWEPIGTNSYPYSGKFNGQGKSIDGLYINNESLSDIGLFGFLDSDGEISNLFVSDSYLSGNDCVGGICAQSYGKITNCVYSGTLKAADYYTGGICSRVESGEVNGCKNYGNIYAKGYAGGVCGLNKGSLKSCTAEASIVASDECVGGVCGCNFSESASIYQCYNTGSVSSEGFEVGGVCGENFSSVSASYNTGAVSGNNYTGGVCGENFGTLTGCYNEGTVSSTDDYIGGVCGENFNGTVSECYNTGSITEANDYVGGVCGCNYNGTVSGCYNTGSVTEANDYVGGVCGYNDGTTVNCYSTGSLNAVKDYVGGVCGISYGTVANSYFNSDAFSGFSLGNYVDESAPADDASGVTNEEFASGEIAYLLLQGCSVETDEGTVTYDGSVWGQKIGTDSIPVFSDDKVYKISLPESQAYSFDVRNKFVNPLTSTDLTLTINSQYYASSDFDVKLDGKSCDFDVDNTTGKILITIDGVESDADLTLEGVEEDKVAPSAKIKIYDNTWSEFFNDTTFGMFYKKDYIDIFVEPQDELSGVKSVEMYISAEPFNSADDIPEGWSKLTKDYNGIYRLCLVPIFKGFIYVRVTDYAGNMTVLNSDGFVAYTDAEQDTASISFDKFSTDDVPFKVKLNGNTVKAIYNGDDLIAEENYSVENETVTLKASYLQTLPGGSYKLYVEYNPLGEEYKDASDNDVPNMTTLDLTVSRAQGTLSVANPTKTYDKTPVTTKYETNNTKGEVVVEYKKQGEDDSAYTTVAPINAGSYTVRVTVKESDDYTEAVSTPIDFTIEKKAVTISGMAVEATKVYDGSANAVITENGTIAGLIDGDNVTIVTGTAAYNDKNVGKKKTVSFSGFALDGEDKENYVLTSQPESVKADISEKELTVKVTVNDKQYDGTNKAEIASAELTGILPDEDVKLVNGTATFNSVNAGDDIAVSFTGFSLDGADAGNYKFTQPTDVTAKIYNNYSAAQNTDYTVNSNDWINTDFVVTANEGYLLSLTNTADGEWVETLTASDETEDGKLTFYVMNVATGAISVAVTESYKLFGIYGDVSSNGEVSMEDVTTLQKYIAKLITLTPAQLKAADVTGDGKITMEDVTAIQKYIAKLMTEFPAERI